MSLRPNIDQEKPSPFNTVSTWVGSTESIGTFQARVTRIEDGRVFTDGDPPMVRMLLGLARSSDR